MKKTNELKKTKVLSKNYNKKIWLSWKAYQTAFLKQFVKFENLAQNQLMTSEFLQMIKNEEKHTYVNQ